MPIWNEFAIRNQADQFLLKSICQHFFNLFDVIDAEVIDIRLCLTDLIVFLQRLFSLVQDVAEGIVFNLQIGNGLSGFFPARVFFLPLAD